MKKNLILTGWSKPVYLAAAAAALKAVKGDAESGLPDNLDAAIRNHTKSVFDKYNQNLTAAKDALGISLNTLKKYLAEK